VLLPETDSPEATNVAERMRQSVEARPFRAAGPITISIGVATMYLAEQVEDLIARASMACLEAKRQGRNTVIPAPAGSGEGDGAVQVSLFKVDGSSRSSA
jgi:two-component system, cell cycle response regulator